MFDRLAQLRFKIKFAVIPWGSGLASRKSAGFLPIVPGSIPARCHMWTSGLTWISVGSRLALRVFLRVLRF